MNDTNINVNNIHPPPEIEEVLTFFNSKKPMRNHNRCHAYMILRYSVAKEFKRIGEFNAILIGKATNHIWKNSTSQEKAEYVNLAQRTTPPEIDEVLNCLCGTITDAVPIRYLDILLQRNARE
ncbi:hypothetical protein Glove_310g23 [Diversispora epigaea]|uniref:HMG box domain-containing protein n=1 Tax=Diversispora epigaea TaxID=1348612 RepID=A0A397HXJ9_9GLOM|nr:hypothetical protein Glove_310g23 [Diversispora epigaea]